MNWPRTAFRLAALAAWGLAAAAGGQSPDGSAVKGFRLPEYDEEGRLKQQLYGETATFLPDGIIQLTGVKIELTVPLSALGESAGDNRYKVKVLRNGETREREVVIGARNDTDVVVVKGLEEGEEVVTSETLPGAAQ